MQEISFDGQQTDERVLYEIAPPPATKYLSIIKFVSIVVIFYLFILLITAVAIPARALTIAGFILSLTVLLIGLWWIELAYRKSRSFITDRRIIRFEQATPFVSTKRELFWNEALKAKVYSRGFLNRLMGVGTVEVEPHLSTSENVRISQVGWYEDIGNYIDKILFTFKNKPEDIPSIKPFVPKPRGKRDN